MRKARKDDILDLMDLFSKKYDVDIDYIQPIILKGILNLPAYRDIISTALAKTSDGRFILLVGNSYNKISDEKNKSNSFFNDYKISKIKNSDIEILLHESVPELLSSVLNIIENSSSLKDLIDDFTKTFTLEDLHAMNTIHNTPLFEMMLSVHSAEQENDFHKINILKEKIVNSFLHIVRQNNMNTDIFYNSILQNSNFKEFKELFSNLVSNYFDLFKYHHEINLGLAAISETEQSLLNKPIINDFFDLLSKEYPEYFFNDNISLHEYSVDDHELINSQKSINDILKPFNLFDIRFLPQLNSEGLSGFYNIPERSSDGLNSVRFIGENPFFTKYYVYLEHIKSANKLDVYNLETIDFIEKTSIDIIENVVRKCLELAQETGFILNINKQFQFISTENDNHFNIVTCFHKLSIEYPNVVVINTEDRDLKIANHSKNILAFTNDDFNINKKSLSNNFKQKI